MDDNEKKHFDAWLKKNTSFSDKVIRDTVSRVCRIEKITLLETSALADDFLFTLGKKTTFKQLSMSVKSQLKRAYKLYHQYKTGK